MLVIGTRAIYAQPVPVDTMQHRMYDPQTDGAAFASNTRTKLLIWNVSRAACRIQLSLSAPHSPFLSIWDSIQHAFLMIFFPVAHGKLK